MANRLLFCSVEVLLSAVVLWFPVKTLGLHPPSGVNVKAVHGSDFLIISWNYQRDVPYYRILFANPPDEAGPTPVYCLPDNTTCSYCVSNLNTPDVSCITLNSHYTASVSIKLDYEQLVSVRVEACKDLIPEECLQRSEWTNYTIPPGGLHPPSGVNVKAVHGSDFLIISWNYQRDVPYYRILFANPPDEAGPTPVYCLPDNTTCSYCVSNLNTPDVSCITLNSHYTESISIELDYEQLVSVRVEACKDLIPEECLQRSEWTNYTIPPGAPSPVRNVHARPLSSTTVEVTWTAPNQTRGTIVLYSVLYEKENDQQMKRVFKNAGKGILTRLSAKTTYKIWVTASTSNREGQRSTLTTVETYADECESSPCKYNGKCHLYGGSYKCLCEEDWEGPRCEIPEGFYMKGKKCLDAGREGNSSLYSNVSLEFCVKECRAISSCKSFEYGLGYNSSGTFVNTLHIKSLGLCKLQHASVSHQPLNDCPYDYYEKKPPVSSSSDVFLSKALFTGHLALMTFVTAILSLSPLALV